MEQLDRQQFARPSQPPARVQVVSELVVYSFYVCSFAPSTVPYHCHDSMAEKDSNQEALEQVEKATDSEPVSSDELLESPDLKRQLKEAKERLASEPPRK